MFYITRKLIRRLPGIVIKAVPLPEPEMLSGPGSSARAGEICRKNGFRSVLLVTDRTVYSLGLHEEPAASLTKNGIKCTVFSDISSEPDLDIIDRGRQALARCGAEAVIALGGGAVMDSCKMIAAGGRLKGRSSKSLLHKFLFAKGKTLPLIAIPTTAGTGAEITVGAVVTDEKGRKGSTVIVGLDVKGVILDGALMLKTPEKITCACAIDALSHGLEGVAASVRVPDEDMRRSMECVRLVLENLPVLIREPENISARQSMCMAADHGGNAINRQLAGYVHAFAHSIGARYHISHGNAIALSLMPVMDMQKDKCLAPLAALARYCGLCATGDDDAAACGRLFAAIRALIDMCAFEKLTVPREDYASIARAVELDSINYSAPVVLSRRQIYNVLDSIGR